MSGYDATIGVALPTYVVCSPRAVRVLVAKLLADDRDDGLPGSSFAVTVDGRDGKWRLWLSETSHKYLVQFYPFEALNGEGL